MPADADTRTRTHLANERTFLAWFRTGLTLVALGVAAAHFLTLGAERDFPLVRTLATLVIALGLVLVAVGLWRYVRGRARIEAEAFEPAQLSVVVTSVVAVATGLLAVALVWLTPGS